MGGLDSLKYLEPGTSNTNYRGFDYLNQNTGEQQFNKDKDCKQSNKLKSKQDVRTYRKKTEQ